MLRLRSISLINSVHRKCANSLAKRFGSKEACLLSCAFFLFFYISKLLEHNSHVCASLCYTPDWLICSRILLHNNYEKDNKSWDDIKYISNVTQNNIFNGNTSKIYKLCKNTQLTSDTCLILWSVIKSIFDWSALPNSPPSFFFLLASLIKICTPFSTAFAGSLNSFQVWVQSTLKNHKSITILLFPLFWEKSRNN